MVVPNKSQKGDGSVYQRKSDGLWCGAVTLPSPDGSRRRKVVTAKTERLVKEKLKLVKRELIMHGDIQTEHLSVEQWLNEWFPRHRAEIRPKTAASYGTTIEQYLKPSIGSKQLKKLTPDHVRQSLKYVEGKGLSSRSVQLTYQVLSLALKDAYREGHLTRNIADLVARPRLTKSKRTILAAHHGVKVLETVTEDRLGSRWAAALLTGARQGELLGLELDRVGDDLDLSWQLQRHSWEHGCAGTCDSRLGSGCPKRKVTYPKDWEARHLTGGLWLSRPKSDAGWRIIPLVDPLRSIIERRLEVAQTEPNPHGLLWTADPKGSRHGLEPYPLDGSPIDPSRDNKAWHAILERADVPQARLHDARHTTASLLLKAGVPMEVITKILGHSSVAQSASYTDVDRDQLVHALTRMSALMQVPRLAD